ncbi:hypothetical protein IC582_012695 [Cucumis melo]
MEPIDGLTSTNYKAGSVSSLQMAISSVFSRWDGLQMAIENQWGGRDSHQKSLNLVSDVFSWFSYSKRYYPSSLNHHPPFKQPSAIIS